MEVLSRSPQDIQQIRTAIAETANSTDRRDKDQRLSAILDQLRTLGPERPEEFARLATELKHAAAGRNRICAQIDAVVAAILGTPDASEGVKPSRKRKAEAGQSVASNKRQRTRREHEGVVTEMLTLAQRYANEFPVSHLTPNFTSKITTIFSHALITLEREQEALIGNLSSKHLLDKIVPSLLCDNKKIKERIADLYYSEVRGHIEYDYLNGTQTTQSFCWMLSAHQTAGPLLKGGHWWMSVLKGIRLRHLRLNSVRETMIELANRHIENQIHTEANREFDRLCPPNENRDADPTFNNTDETAIRAHLEEQEQLALGSPETQANVLHLTRDWLLEMQNEPLATVCPIETFLKWLKTHPERNAGNVAAHELMGRLSQDHLATRPNPPVTEDSEGIARIRQWLDARQEPIYFS